MAWIIDSFLGLAQAISSFISQAIEILINCLFYPFERVLYWLGAIINLFIECFVGIISSLWNIYTILYDFLSSILVSIMPYTLTVIILTGITIVFLFRIYHFIKDVSILGNKI